MTARTDIERILDVWLGEGPAFHADRVVNLVAASIAGQPQRRAWRGWWASARPEARTWLSAAAAALAIVAVLGASLLLGGWPGVGGPQPSPTPGPTAIGTPLASPTPTPPPTPELPTPLVSSLEAGAHTSSGFAVPVTFTVPTGWQLDADEQSAFGLSRSAGSVTENIEILSDVYPVELELEGCQQRINWDRPHTASALMAELRARSTLRVSATPVTIGGLVGWTAAVTVRTDVPTCTPDSEPVFVIHWSDGIPVTNGLGKGATMTFTVLDDTHGGTLVIAVRGDGATFQAEADAIVASLEFSP